ncbi:MAG: GGDEF domain-containing protein [Ketobacter sp.]|nr:MAG: GGDEF domain-containing protein [Ketobacter sp.]
MHLVLISLLFLILPLHLNAEPLSLPLDKGRAELNQYIEYIEDKNSTLTIQALLQNTLDWQPNSNQTFNKSYNDSSWWLRLHITNPDQGDIKRLIEISYAVLDYVDVYIVSDGKVQDSYHLGDKHAYHQRVIDHRFFIIPVQWKSHQSLEIYLRIKSSSAVQAPMVMWDEQTFYGFDTTRTILQGIFFGTMLVMATYNLFIFFVLGERTYLLYVGYVLCMPLFLASLGGYSFKYLWPTLTEWNDRAIVVFLAGVVVFGAAFTRKFLLVSHFAPRLDHLLRLSFYGGLTLAMCAFILPYHYNIIAIIIWASLACILALVTGATCWRGGLSTAKYYTIAWTAMLFGGLVLALNKANILPANLFTEYATHIGSSLEVVLLSFALAERINIERRLRYEAQEQTLITTRRINEELESRVQERTQELEALTQQLRDLSNTDQLTGLCNRRHLESSFYDEWERAKRYQRDIAVIMIDIDHFKTVNDTHGHLVGDDCLQEVARRIQEGVRWPSDLAARFGGEEFCILLPETGLKGALIVAERIRTLVAATPVTTRSHSLSITISAGVYSLVPSEEKSIDQTLNFADKALYQAKDKGRNQVFSELAA